MDGILILLGVLVGLALLLAPIGVLILSSKLRNLTARVTELEAMAPKTELQAVLRPDVPEDWVAPEVARARANAAPIATETQPANDEPVKKVNRSVVFRGELFVRALNWMKENWFLGVAAISLALAGIFMVQYGVEQGLLTPSARVIGALALGAGFIGLGEFTRRRFGDESGTMNAMPSTFSGAGIVTLFAAVLSARHLYDLLPSDLALLALIGVAGLAVVLGWFYGPFLAAIGVVGAMGAPFVVDGSSDAPHLFFYYFALIIVMALSIDTVRRWAWVSVLALFGGFIATWMLLISGADAWHALVFVLIVVIAATAIPIRRIWPNHAGATLTDTLLSLRKKKTREWPEFPTWIAIGTFVTALGFCAFITIEATSSLEAWLGIFCIAVLGGLALIWMWRADALSDLSLLAPMTLLVLIWILAIDRNPVFKEFAALSDLERAEGGAMPLAASLFSGMFAVFAALGFWRASQGTRGSLIWVGASALALPAALGALELFWAPAKVIGAYPWAGHAIAAAALMTLLAERSAKRWRVDLRPAALFAMSALSLVTFALMLILSSAALSVAIAVMIVLAALIDRRFDMAWLGLFIQLAVAVLGWRFLVDPGLEWATSGVRPLWELALGYAVPLALIGAAWWILQPLKRLGAQLALESTIWSFSAVFLLILLERFLGRDFDSFWGVSMAGTVLLISMGTQLYRWRKGLRFAWLRIALASLFGAFSLIVLGIGLIALSPLTSWGARDIEGPLVFDTIAIAYLIPAAVFAVLAWKLAHVNKWLRAAFACLSAVLTLAYIGLEIRRFWQGSDIAKSAVSQGELYSYTIAMMLASVGLLLFAFSRRSVLLRKLAMTGIAVTIAKVFLIDMSGLTGLIRVASFLGLGLALSGLAWLSRAMTARWEDGAPQAIEDQAQPALDPEQ